MNVWFMRDCHLFTLVGDATTSRSAMEAKARECFAEDRCGSLFARDTGDHEIAKLDGKPMAGGGYGVTDAELQIFFDRVEEWSNWEAR